MIRKVFIFSTVIALSGCFAGKHKVQALPDAELNKPYFIELRTKYAAYPNHFNVEMDPPNSGLTVKPETFAKFLFLQQPKPKNRFSAVFSPNHS